MFLLIVPDEQKGTDGSWSEATSSNSDKERDPNSVPCHLLRVHGNTLLRYSVDSSQLMTEWDHRLEK